MKDSIPATTVPATTTVSTATARLVAAFGPLQWVEPERLPRPTLVPGGQDSGRPQLPRSPQDQPRPRRAA